MCLCVCDPVGVCVGYFLKEGSDYVICCTTPSDILLAYNDLVQFGCYQHRCECMRGFRLHVSYWTSTEAKLYPISCFQYRFSL